MSEASGSKRRRVAKACESCRALKAKCDGTQPICDRCEGYGYSCEWAGVESRGRGNHAADTRSNEHAASNHTAALRKAIQAYDNLVKNSCMGDSDINRNAIETGLLYIRQHLPQDLRNSLSIVQSPASPSDVFNANLAQAVVTDNTERFLGDSSDIHFFNVIKKILGGNDETGNDDSVEQLESYEQADSEPQSVAPLSGFPTRAVADNYLEVYFTTIHIAYPFVYKPLFETRYRRLWNKDAAVETDSCWLALLNNIFAIGAYYVTVADSSITDRSVHAEYFQLALVYAGRHANDCTLDNICVLLTQCFYLLAISKTDQCWTTLGRAVRVGQSVGLHVEGSARYGALGTREVKREMRRRAWYSLYVLDRLLSLQLGRPAAIHDQDYNRSLPSRLVDSAFDGEGDFGPSMDCNEPSAGDYFLSVIAFSHIIGRVLRDLFSPLQSNRSSDDMLRSTADLDASLLKWRANLPRVLRFDLGHTFEKSVIFKRQRNMLAMKFHQLRALIHRPYLCLQWLRRNDSASVVLLQRARLRIRKLERICIAEARATAHLLHNIEDERDLVRDFPWWQMIPCLICAVSILLVAEAFAGRHEGPAAIEEMGEDDPLPALREDAETCFKVFDALSATSDAAKVARDMIERLKRLGADARGVQLAPVPRGFNVPTSYSHLTNPVTGDISVQHPSLSLLSTLQASAPSIATETGVAVPASGLLGEWQGNGYADADLWNDIGFREEMRLWPSEVSDAMMWSSQFVPQWFDPIVPDDSSTPLSQAGTAMEP